MELNINSPAYFKDHYGIDDKVYRFCREAYRYFKDKEYSEVLHIIGIIPVVAPQEIYESGAWKESVGFRCCNSSASITVRISFEDYYHADSKGKILLMKDAVLKAVKKVKTRGKFDYQVFEKDFEILWKNGLQ